VEARPIQRIQRTCNRLGIDHATTRVKHPWTNSYRERLNKDPHEFYAVTFKGKRDGGIEKLRVDLDNVMDYYNYRRVRQGYKSEENDCRIRAETRPLGALTANGKSGSVRQAESIRGEKEVQEDLPLPMILWQQRTRIGRF